ncbi:transcription factor HES-3-like [Hypanus sabinus]|uniref:transcription factor HES-3-like n=1 Tax=Hypanus sabinus TaxID=79690 RepID=UPI0028C4B164|nr:transcription factor HES-3-like [Hypanus sabinus]
MKNSSKPVGRFQLSLTTPACNYRKISKPLMEKKRRARINECLEQLKTLLEEHYSNNIRKRKLEKADILELTVKHLRDLQSSRQGALVLSQDGVAEYQAGFRSCLNGVSQYLLRSKSTDEHLRLGVLNHLVNAFPVFSASGFSTADSGCRFEVSPSTRLHSVQASFNQSVPPPSKPTAPTGRSGKPPPPSPSLVRRSSHRRVAELTLSEQKSIPETPAKEKRSPASSTDTKTTTNLVLSPDSEALWRPW